MPKITITPGSRHVGRQLPDGSIEWVKIDGPPLAFALEASPYGPADLEAKRIVAGATRNTILIKYVEERLAAVLYAKYKLDEYLQTPIGEFQVKHEPTEFRALWFSYFIEGRQLIDKLGDCIPNLFTLQQKLKTGLNKDKFRALRNVVPRSGQKNPDWESLVQILDRFEEKICLFIALRNQEKDYKNTIKEFPKVMPDGTCLGGIVQLLANLDKGSEHRELSLRTYLDDSCRDLIAFTKALLGVVNS